MKSSLLEATDTVCGGPARHKESWWSNEEMSKAIGEKRKAYLAWKKSDTVADKEVCNKAMLNVKRVVAAAQATKRQEFSENLRSAEGKGYLFRVVK